jgi:hypothetical protein
MPTIGNENDVARQMNWINQNEAAIAQLNKQAQQATDFYKARVDALDKRNDDLRTNCARFMTLNNFKKLVTWAGTISLKASKKVVWPEDDVLVAFAKANGGEHVDELIRTKESPNKKDLKKFIESSGLEPEGYRIEEKEITSIIPRKD